MITERELKARFGMSKSSTRHGLNTPTPQEALDKIRLQELANIRRWEGLQKLYAKRS